MKIERSLYLTFRLLSEVESMRTPVVLLLLVFWIFLAYRAVQRGDTVMAVVLVVVGISLTAYRLQRR
jgi:predicted benzoate:H+ symporter BenE